MSMVKIFDIFIAEHRLECPTSMREIQDIFGEKSISGKIGKKEFIHPLIDPLAYCHGLACRRRRMSSHNDPNAREPFAKREPASIKQLDDLTSSEPGHARCWWIRQHASELGMLQELIASAACHDMNMGKHDLSDHHCIAILSIEPSQSHL